MNNNNEIKLINENGAEKTYGRIPDLWHIAMSVGNGMDLSNLSKEDRGTLMQEILDVWHMAHDLKSVVEGQGQARLVEPAPPTFEIIEAKRNTPLVMVRVHSKVKFMQKSRIDPASLQAHYEARREEAPEGQA